MRDVGAGKDPGATGDEPVVVGKIVGLYGVRGWVKVFSYTRPLENILQYTPWWLRRDEQWQQVSRQAKRQGAKGIIASIAGWDDRDTARTLLGVQVGIIRAHLPSLAEGEYYWTELVGMRVETVGGETLGHVAHFMETGADDVMVVRNKEDAREHLLPFVRDQVVLQVDRDNGVIRVDWDIDY